MKRYLNLLCPLLAALLVAVARLPLYMGFLSFMAYVPLLYMFEKQELKNWQLLSAGLVYSAVSTLILFYWFSIVTKPGLVGVILLYGWYYFLVLYIIRRIWIRLPRFRYIGFISVWLGFQYIQNFGELRFAWFDTGYSLVDYNYLIQAADLIGVFGLSALVLIVNVLLYRGLIHRSEGWRSTRKAIAWLLLIFIPWLAYGWYCVHKLPLTRHEAGIFVMQPSIKQSEKWDRDEFFRIMKVYHERCMEAQYNDARLLIFPEAAIPEHIMLLDPDQVLMSQFLDTYKFDIFTGFPHAEYSEERSKEDPYKYYNAATLFRPGKQAGDLYYKIILVPVAERMPWLAYFPILWKLQFGQANWEYGTEIRYYKSGNYLFSPSICYEIAFSDLNLQMAVAKDSFSKNNPTQEPRTYRKSDYLVNITNDAWFGTSYGPWMHSIMARFRAIESRIQIYRSANTGISMIVSPTGRVLEKAGLFESQNITAPLYKSSRITLFRRIYLYPMAVTILALLLFLFAAIRKRSGGSNT